MDIHKPLPWRGWPELLKEVGTIVVGVLIALGAEQAVQWLNWRHQVHEVEDAIRLEITTDDGPQGVARLAIERCLSQQLEAIQTAIEAGADRGQIRRLVENYAPPRRTWDAEAWRAATSSQVASHMPAAVMLAWSNPYQVIPQLAATNDKEQLDAAALRAGRHATGPASTAEQERWLVALENLRHDNDAMAYASWVLLVAANAQGVSVPAAAQRDVVSEMRAHYGPCVVTPDISGLNLNSQVNQGGHR
jgi:hypothetical protein